MDRLLNLRPNIIFKFSEMVACSGGFRISRVVLLANFSLRVLGFTVKSCGFWGLRCVAGCGFGLFMCSGFGYFTQDSHFVGFSKSYSPLSQLRLKNQLSNALKRGAGSR